MRWLVQVNAVGRRYAAPVKAESPCHVSRKIFSPLAGYARHNLLDDRYCGTVTNDPMPTLNRAKTEVSNMLLPRRYAMD
jgi:hypothetical protein